MSERLTRGQTVAKILAELDSRVWNTIDNCCQLRLYSRYEVECVREALAQASKTDAVPQGEERRQGHSAMRVRDGKIECFDPNPAARPSTPVAPPSTADGAVASLIDDGQESALVDMMELYGVSLAAFNKQAGIKSLRELKAERFDGAVKWLKTHKVSA